MDTKLDREYFHLQGFEITRSLVFEGEHEELPQMFKELGEVLEDLDFQAQDRIQTVRVQQVLNQNKTKITVTLITQPRGQ